MRTLSIKIPNVSESLETKLEALIMGGAFWPDQPLVSERKLAEEFNVSRTSLRAALANLCDSGLLHLMKRHHVTNVMADLLGPGLSDVAESSPRHILDYWTILFHETVLLARKKARTSDKVQIKKHCRELKKCIVGDAKNEAVSAFERLTRAVFDSCYNFFLSQTHHAFYSVSFPLFEKSIANLCDLAADDIRILEQIDAIAELEFDIETWRGLLDRGFVAEDVDLPALKTNGVTAGKIIEATLRHPVAFESVYELRLISETHAAFQAASNATEEQKTSLNAHLENMTLLADMASADYSKLDTELHRLIALSSQNPVFAVIDAALAPIFSQTTNQWLARHLELRRDQSTIHLQHTQIVEAIIDSRAEDAKEHMEEHLAYVLRNLRFMREQDHLHEIATARRLLS
ncbi:MAG: FCD domain-containing protein [Pseudomonadota bacterium]